MHFENLSFEKKKVEIQFKPPDMSNTSAEGGIVIDNVIDKVIDNVIDIGTDILLSTLLL